MKKIILFLPALLALGACSRIETGEVGVRRGFDKTIQMEELPSGSFNQTIVGDVLKFPFKDVSVEVKDLTPLAADNSTVKDFDMSVIYSINPGAVAELYATKSRSFHADTEDGQTLLMYNYIYQLARTSAYKAARQFPSLKLGDNRAQIEQIVQSDIQHQLAAEGLAASITISQVMVKQILPADNIVESANALVQAENDTKRKAQEVQTAELEAKRIAALNANKGAIGYMNATANVTIAEAIKEGNVNTIIIPHDFKGIVNANNPSN
jgi:regulator of protease activity HflC (stomatin/prohibitin superfamily)